MKVTKLLFLLLCGLVLFAGCGYKVQLVGPYDDVLDKSIYQLESKTIQHIQKIIDNKGVLDGSFEANKEFYLTVKAEIQVLMKRAKISEENSKKMTLTQLLGDLQEQYDDLARLHKLKFNEKNFLEAQKPFDQSYIAIVEYVLALKWNFKKTN